MKYLGRSLLSISLVVGLLAACGDGRGNRGDDDDDDGSSTLGTGGGFPWGSGAGGLEVPEGPPGTVGNLCDGYACEDGLVCGASGYCQPDTTSLPYQVVQAVPTPDSAEIPSSAPIMLFLDGTYANLTFQVEAYGSAGPTDITSSVTTNKLTSGANKDVVILSRTGGFPLGTSVVVTVNGDIQGTLVFNVDHVAPQSANAKLGFEGGGAVEECSGTASGALGLPSGWKGFGDVGVLGPSGSLVPSEGSSQAVLTTGNAVCGSALSGTSSLLVSGPIDMGSAQSIAFDYNFQSSEFDDYCNSSYDDTFLVVLAGPKGTVSKVVDSVNIVCSGGSYAEGSFPGMPDGGDSVYKETGARSGVITGDVGTPAVLAFVITDVGDTALSSVVGIDNIRVQ